MGRGITILSWIFGLFFLFAGLGNIISKSFIASIILIAIAIVLIPPTRRKIFGENFFKNKFKFQAPKSTSKVNKKKVQKITLKREPLKPSQINTLIAMGISLIVVIGFHYFLGNIFIDLFRIFGIGKAVYYGMLVFIFFSGTGLGVMMLNASEVFRKIAD